MLIKKEKTTEGKLGKNKKLFLIPIYLLSFLLLFSFFMTFISSVEIFIPETIYGDMHYHNDSATGFLLPIASQGAWINVTGFNTASNEIQNYSQNSVTFNAANEGLICDIQGRYFSSYKISHGNSGNNQEYQFQLSVDGVRKHITDSHRKIGASGDVGDISGIGSFDCTTGQLINLQVRNLDGTADLQVHVVTVSLTRIGDIR